MTQMFKSERIRTVSAVRNLLDIGVGGKNKSFHSQKGEKDELY